MLICSRFLNQGAATHRCCKREKKMRNILKIAVNSQDMEQRGDTWLLGSSLGKDTGDSASAPAHLYI